VGVYAYANPGSPGNNNRGYAGTCNDVLPGCRVDVQSQQWSTADSEVRLLLEISPFFDYYSHLCIHGKVAISLNNMPSMVPNLYQF